MTAPVTPQDPAGVCSFCRTATSLGPRGTGSLSLPAPTPPPTPRGQTRPGELHAGKESPVPPVGRALGSCVTTWHTPIPGAGKCSRRRSGDASEKMPQLDAAGGAEPPPRTARTGSPCPLSQARLKNRLQEQRQLCLPSVAPPRRPAGPSPAGEVGCPGRSPRLGAAGDPTRSCWPAASEQP